MSLKQIVKNAQGVPTGEYINVAGGTMYADSPIGSILPYGGATAPSGWFLCQGQSLLRTDYPELFAVIGTAFGSADSTHFNIPDLRGEFLRGAGTNSHTGQGSGGSVGTHQDATLQAASMATTTYIDVYALNADGTNFINSDAGGNVDLIGYSRVSTPLNPGGGAKKMAMRPTNTSVNYIIKAKMVALPADLDAGVDAKIAADKVNSITSGNTKSVTSGAVFSGLTDIVKVVDASGSVTLEANSQKQVTLNFTCPAGYKAILATPKSAGSWAFVWAFCYLQSQSKVYTVIKSCLSQDETQTIYATVLCVKTTF